MELDLAGSLSGAALTPIPLAVIRHSSGLR